MVAGIENSGDHKVGEDNRAPQSDASGLLGGQGVAGAYPNGPPLPLGNCRHDGGNEFSSGAGGVKSKVECNQRPSLSLPLSQQVGRVDDGSCCAVQFRNHKGASGTRRKQVKGVGHAGAGEVFGRESGVLHHLNQNPTLLVAMALDRSPLAVEGQSAVGLLGRGYSDVADDGRGVCCRSIPLSHRVILH